MTKLKKRLIVGASIAGAILALGQAVWADGNNGKKADQAQVTAVEHTAHHSGTSTANAAAPQTSNPAMQHEMMGQMGSGNMDEMMKMMGNGSMDEMMKMMQTPEGKQLMEKCLELLQKQPAAAVKQ